jgi:hypothetical protein
MKEDLMRIRRLIVVACLILTIGLLWSLQAGAYQLFSADNGRCSQCHTDWPGTTHSLHTGFDCSACHFESDPVAVNSCTACHGGAEGILGAHADTEAPNGEYCGYCHVGVGVENWSMTDLKELFK